jgi:hypothetical protein
VVSLFKIGSYRARIELIVEVVKERVGCRMGWRRKKKMMQRRGATDVLFASPNAEVMGRCDL